MKYPLHFVFSHVQPITQKCDLKSTSTIKVAVKIVDDFQYHVPTNKLTFFAVRMDEWDTKKDTSTLVHEEYSGMAKGRSQAEATPNSEISRL